MIVCHCARVTDRDIHSAIQSGATSLAAVVRSTGAGRCCQPCRDEIVSLLRGAAVTCDPEPRALV